MIYLEEAGARRLRLDLHGLSPEPGWQYVGLHALVSDFQVSKPTDRGFLSALSRVRGALLCDDGPDGVYP